MSTLAEVADKLDTLIRLTAIGLFGDKTQREKIELLSSAGLQPKEIADLLGTTANSVNVALSGIRKKKRKKKASRKGQSDD